MKGFGFADNFYDGVEVQETFEKDFRPLPENPLYTPVMLILILDLFFRLTPATMVAETPEVQELARLLKLKPTDVTLVLNVFQRCDPYLNRDNQITSELMAPCKQVWQRYGTIATEQLQQSISQQQLLQSQLVELPLQQLAERIETEMHDNPALETTSDDPEFTEYSEYNDDSETSDDYDIQREREERSDALDAALENIGRDDEELPVYQGGRPAYEEHEDMVLGESQSFYDQLLEQVGELELSDQDRYVMEYLIRSLDDDGLLRASIEGISDELAIYHNIDLTKEQIEAVLHKLQQLDPPGIGARSLQECLLLQVDRKEKSSLTNLMKRVLTDYFDAFTKKHWDKIQRALALDDLQTDELLHELRRLNPKPGAAMGETIGRSMQQIIDLLEDEGLNKDLVALDKFYDSVRVSFRDSFSRRVYFFFHCAYNTFVSGNNARLYSSS